MNIPKNCDECKHTDYCNAFHYGSDRCEYEEVINQKAIEEAYLDKQDS